MIPNESMQLRWSIFKIMSWPTGPEFATLHSGNILAANERSEMIGILVTDWHPSEVLNMPRLKCWCKKVTGSRGMSREELSQTTDQLKANPELAAEKGILASVCYENPDAGTVLAMDFREGYIRAQLTTGITVGNNVSFHHPEVPW